MISPRYKYISAARESIKTPTGVLILVEIYPVGIFLDAKTSWRSKSYRMNFKSVFRHLKKHEWRAFKNSFNGYHAEPDIFPGKLKRCGSGWTRKRALRDLKRRVRKS